MATRFPRRPAIHYGARGAEGAVLDPLTNDFLFSTFGGGNRVIVVRGFAALPFHDEFTGVPSLLWGNEVGNWTVVGNAYDAQAPASTPPTYSGLPFILGDGTVLVDIQHLQDGGVWLHSTDNQNGVLLVTGGNVGTGTGLYWHSVTGGVVSPKLNEVSGLFTSGVSNAHLRVEMRGDTYSVYVDGSSIPATTLDDQRLLDWACGPLRFLRADLRQRHRHRAICAVRHHRRTSGHHLEWHGQSKWIGNDCLLRIWPGYHLWFDVAASNARQWDDGVPFSFNVGGLFPHAVLHYRAIAVNGVDHVHGEDQTITIPNALPVANPDQLITNGTPESLDPTVNDTDDDLDTLTVTDFTQGAFGTVSQLDNTLTYTPGPDYEGHDSFTYTIDDGFDGTAIGTVTVRASIPITRVLYTGAKDGSGTLTPGEGGATFTKFGIPSINSSGRVAFTSNFKLTKGDVGVFDGISIVAGKGDPAPGSPSISLTSFKDPALGEDGSVAFLAGLKPSVSSEYNQALFTNFGGTFRLVLQKGAAAPDIPDTTIKAFKSFVLTPNGIFFLASLTSLAGTVTTADDTALWYWTPAAGAQLKLREGQSLGGKTLKSFVALKPSSGSPGHGRSARLDDVIVKVSYADGTQGLFSSAAAPGLPRGYRRGHAGSARRSVQQVRCADHQRPFRPRLPRLAHRRAEHREQGRFRVRRSRSAPHLRQGRYGRWAVPQGFQGPDLQCGERRRGAQHAGHHRQ